MPERRVSRTLPCVRRTQQDEGHHGQLAESGFNNGVVDHTSSLWTRMLGLSNRAWREG